MEILIQLITMATVLLFFTIGLAGLPELISDIIKYFINIIKYFIKGKEEKDNE